MFGHTFVMGKGVKLFEVFTIFSKAWIITT